MFWHDRNKVLLLMLYAGRRGQNSECGESRFPHLASYSSCPGTSTSYPRVIYQFSPFCNQQPKFNQVCRQLWVFPESSRKYSSRWQQNLEFVQTHFKLVILAGPCLKEKCIILLFYYYFKNNNKVKIKFYTADAWLSYTELYATFKSCQNDHIYKLSSTVKI